MKEDQIFQYKGNLAPHNNNNNNGASDLHVGEVHAVEVAEHLVDLRRVLQHGPRRLRQVVQGRVATQRLSKGTYSSNLARRQGGQ